MPYLDLLNAGKPEWYGGIVVAESEESELRGQAQLLQAAWLRDGGNVRKKQEFAEALFAWAKHTNNAVALAHSRTLVGEALR